jgi:hypothetical protein
LASVTVDDVRDVINISSADAPDAKITKMLKRAEVSGRANRHLDTRGRNIMKAWTLDLKVRQLQTESLDQTMTALDLLARASFFDQTVMSALLDESQMLLSIVF